MKPQPMSDEEIDSIIYASRQADEGPSALARRFAAARDAQWAAMIGEPVAWLLRPKVQPHSGKMIVRDAYTVEPSAKQMAIAEADNGEYLPLYAIKETP